MGCNLLISCFGFVLAGELAYGAVSKEMWRIAVIVEEPWMFSANVLSMLRRIVLEMGELCPSQSLEMLPDRMWHQKDAISKWTERGVMGVVSFSRNKSEDIALIMKTLPSRGLPAIQLSQICSQECIVSKNSEGTSIQDLQEIAASVFKHYALSNTVVVRGQDGIDSAGVLEVFANTGRALSHIFLHTNKSEETMFLYRQIKRYYSAWNLPDNTDDGRIVIALTKHKAVKEVILKMLKESMPGSRTKFLIMDDLEKWRHSLSNITSYVADFGIITDSPLLQREFPISVQILLDGAKTQFKPNCSYDYVKRSEFGQLVLDRINETLTTNCCRTEDKWYYLWRGYSVDSGRQILHPVAAWSRNFGFLLVDSIKKRITPKLKVALKSYPPLINMTVTGDNVTLWPCMGKYVLDFISHKLGLTYELVAPEGWGTKENGSWNGAIGMILRGEADIVPFLASTSSRMEVLDFTHPLLISDNGILIKKPFEPARALLFLKPFSKEVWFALLVSVPVISVVFYLINYASAYAYGVNSRSKNALCSFSNCLWYIMGAMLQQGGIHTPSSISGRLLAGTWWLAVLVIFSTYSGNLIAFLTFPETKWIAETLSDVISNKNLIIVINTASPIREEIQMSHSTIMRRLGEEFLKRGRQSKLTSKVMKLVKRGKAVYLDDSNYLKAEISRDFSRNHRCRLALASHTFYQMEMSMGMRRGSPYFNSINKIVQELWEMGLLSHWHKRFNVKQERCKVTTTTKKGAGRNVNLRDMGGAFYLLCLGLASAMITVIAEIAILLYSRKRAQVKKIEGTIFTRNNKW